MISWDIGGRPGRTGRPGAQGPPGVPGVRGATGAAGADNSVTGATGPTGRAGAAGANGPEGKAGATGHSGPAGGQTGPTGATGSTGAIGATGPAPPPSAAVGATGATGQAGSPLPAVLATGPTGATGASGPASESGVWSATNPAEPKLGHYVDAVISFPVPLSAKLLCATTFGKPGCKVRYLTKATTEKVEAATNTAGEGEGCVPADSGAKVLEQPVAQPGNLCVYAGIEVLEDAELLGISTAGSADGAERQGAFVEFVTKEIPPAGTQSLIRARGTWAVEAE